MFVKFPFFVCAESSFLQTVLSFIKVDTEILRLSGDVKSLAGYYSTVEASLIERYVASYITHEKFFFCKLIRDMCMHYLSKA